VQALKGKSAAFELLEVFLEGDLAAYRAWTAKNSVKLADLGLDEKQAERKMRMLSLAGLVAGKEGKEVEYKTISKALEIGEGEVEVWVIDGASNGSYDYPEDSGTNIHFLFYSLRSLAIRAGLLDARMNQVTRSISVRRATIRAFTSAHWTALHAKLEGWRSGLVEILGVLENAKVLVESDCSRGCIGGQGRVDG
jgi:translation initiation factor 3 subunit M